MVVSDIAVINPFSGEHVGSVPRQSAADVERAIAAARGRQPLDLDGRAELLGAVARALSGHSEEFARRITAEAGIALKESTKEVARACGNLQAAAEEAKRVRGEAIPIPSTHGERIAITRRVPVGVVGALTPFNRPLNQVVVKAAPAIAAGNAIVVKPSEKTPLSAIAFAKLVVECGAPYGTMSVITGAPEVVGSALAGGAVDMLTFTGSPAIGHKVALAAAGKRVALELGGNDPLIVLADGDLDFAARLAVDQAFATAGQSCRGVKRIIVEDSVADALVSRIAERASAITCGDPLDPSTDVGPLIDEASAVLVKRRCEQAIASGSDLICGGQRDGALFSPTVIDRVPPTAELVMQETFGPVAPVIRVKTSTTRSPSPTAHPTGFKPAWSPTACRDSSRLRRALKWAP